MMRYFVKREKKEKLSIFNELEKGPPYALNVYDRDYLVKALKHYRVVQSEKQIKQTATSW